MNMDLKQIRLAMTDYNIDIKTEVVKAKSLTGVDRKFKGVLKGDPWNGLKDIVLSLSA